MPKITLYAFPGACSRVTMNALEEIGLEFDVASVNIRADSRSPDYLALNPKGKVPALVVDGKIMTENAAILFYLDRAHPLAELLPRTGDLFDDSAALTDLIWCSSGLHPLVRQVRRPQNFTTGDPTEVVAMGMVRFAKECERVAARLEANPWWYGKWSIVDVYLNWNCSIAEKGGFPLADYPALVAHAGRVRARPAFQRALAREREMIERDGLPVDAATL